MSHRFGERQSRCQGRRHSSRKGTVRALPSANEAFTARPWRLMNARLIPVRPPLKLEGTRLSVSGIRSAQTDSVNTGVPLSAISSVSKNRVVRDP